MYEDLSNSRVEEGNEKASDKEPKILAKRTVLPIIEADESVSVMVKVKA